MVNVHKSLSGTRPNMWSTNWTSKRTHTVVIVPMRTIGQFPGLSFRYEQDCPDRVHNLMPISYEHHDRGSWARAYTFRCVHLEPIRSFVHESNKFS